MTIPYAPAEDEGPVLGRNRKKKPTASAGEPYTGASFDANGKNRQVSIKGAVIDVDARQNSPTYNPQPTSHDPFNGMVFDTAFGSASIGRSAGPIDSAIDHYRNRIEAENTPQAQRSRLSTGSNLLTLGSSNLDPTRLKRDLSTGDAGDVNLPNERPLPSKTPHKYFSPEISGAVDAGLNRSNGLPHPEQEATPEEYPVNSPDPAFRRLQGQRRREYMKRVSTARGEQAGDKYTPPPGAEPIGDKFITDLTERGTALPTGIDPGFIGPDLTSYKAEGEFYPQMVRGGSLNLASNVQPKTKMGLAGNILGNTATAATLGGPLAEAGAEYLGLSKGALSALDYARKIKQIRTYNAVAGTVLGGGISGAQEFESSYSEDRPFRYSRPVGGAVAGFLGGGAINPQAGVVGNALRAGGGAAAGDVGAQLLEGERDPAKIIGSAATQFGIGAGLAIGHGNSGNPELENMQPRPEFPEGPKDPKLSLDKGPINLDQGVRGRTVKRGAELRDPDYVPKFQRGPIVEPEHAPPTPESERQLFPYGKGERPTPPAKEPMLPGHEAPTEEALDNLFPYSRGRVSQPAKEPMLPGHEVPSAERQGNLFPYNKGIKAENGPIETLPPEPQGRKGESRGLDLNPKALPRENIPADTSRYAPREQRNMPPELEPLPTPSGYEPSERIPEYGLYNRNAKAIASRPAEGPQTEELSAPARTSEPTAPPQEGPAKTGAAPTETRILPPLARKGEPVSKADWQGTEHAPVSSSNIKSVAYDPTTQRMRVKFNRGEEYEYQNVSPEDHKAFVAAESQGKHFQANIRNKYNYSVVKEGTDAGQDSGQPAEPGIKGPIQPRYEGPVAAKKSTTSPGQRQTPRANQPGEGPQPESAPAKSAADTSKLPGSAKGGGVSEPKERSSVGGETKATTGRGGREIAPGIREGDRYSRPLPKGKQESVKVLGEAYESGSKGRPIKGYVRVQNDRGNIDVVPAEQLTQSTPKKSAPAKEPVAQSRTPENEVAKLKAENENLSIEEANTADEEASKSMRATIKENEKRINELQQGVKREPIKPNYQGKGKAKPSERGSVGQGDEPLFGGKGDLYGGKTQKERPLYGEDERFLQKQFRNEYTNLRTALKSTYDEPADVEGIKSRDTDVDDIIKGIDNGDAESMSLAKSLLKNKGLAPESADNYKAILDSYNESRSRRAEGRPGFFSDEGGWVVNPVARYRAGKYGKQQQAAIDDIQDTFLKTKRVAGLAEGLSHTANVNLLGLPVIAKHTGGALAKFTADEFRRGVATPVDIAQSKALGVPRTIDEPSLVSYTKALYKGLTKGIPNMVSQAATGEVPQSELGIFKNFKSTRDDIAATLPNNASKLSTLERLHKEEMLGRGYNEETYGRYERWEALRHELAKRGIGPDTPAGEQAIRRLWLMDPHNPGTGILSKPKSLISAYTNAIESQALTPTMLPMKQVAIQRTLTEQAKLSVINSKGARDFNVLMDAYQTRLQGGRIRGANGNPNVAMEREADTAVALALANGELTTFTHSNWVSKNLGKAKGYLFKGDDNITLSALKKATGVALDQAAPFTKINSNVANAVLDNLPIVGQVKNVGFALGETAKNVKNLKAGGQKTNLWKDAYTKEQRRAIATTTGDLGIGAGLLLAGVYLSRSDYLSRYIPYSGFSNAEKGEYTRDQALKRPNGSVYLGSTIGRVPGESVSPFFNILAIGAEYDRIHNGENGTNSLLYDYMQTLSSPNAISIATEHFPIASGLKSVSETLFKPTDESIPGRIADAALSTTANLVPGPLQYIAKELDKDKNGRRIEREPERFDRDRGKAFWDRMEMNLPWLRQNVEEKKDAYGETVTKESGLLSSAIKRDSSPMNAPPSLQQDNLARMVVENDIPLAKPTRDKNESQKAFSDRLELEGRLYQHHLQNIADDPGLVAIKDEPAYGVTRKQLIQEIVKLAKADARQAQFTHIEHHSGVKTTQDNDVEYYLDKVYDQLDHEKEQKELHSQGQTEKQLRQQDAIEEINQQ